MFADTSHRPPTFTTVHEIRQSRLEQGLLQDLLRKAFFWPPPRQFQPNLGHSHWLVLLLHRVQLSDRLPRP